jgi:hypothetical protein
MADSGPAIQKSRQVRRSLSVERHSRVPSSASEAHDGSGHFSPEVERQLERLCAAQVADRRRADGALHDYTDLRSGREPSSMVAAMESTGQATSATAT